MFDLFTKQWKGLRGGAPGRRFVASYNAAQRKVAPLWYRAMNLCLALAALLAGLFFAVMPGPALIFFVIAGGLLAAESKTVAVILDWSEVQGRRVHKKAHARWRKLGWTARVALILVGAGASVGMTVLSLRIFAMCTD